MLINKNRTNSKSNSKIVLLFGMNYDCNAIEMISVRQSVVSVVCIWILYYVVCLVNFKSFVVNSKVFWNIKRQNWNGFKRKFEFVKFLNQFQLQNSKQLFR